MPKPVNPMTKQPEFNGTSVIDVTDPANPKYLAHIPGDEGLGESGGAQMVRICDGKTLPKGDPNAVYMLRVFGNKGHEIWNVTDPAAPQEDQHHLDRPDQHPQELVGVRHRHRLPRLRREVWRTRRMTEIFDLSDPAKPVKIRDFGLVGQQPGATGTVPTDLHGMISTGVKDNRVIFAYGTNQGGVVQIVDREKLLTGPEGADAGEPARSGDRPARHARSTAPTPPFRSAR